MATQSKKPPLHLDFFLYISSLGPGTMVQWLRTLIVLILIPIPLLASNGTIPYHTFGAEI